MGLEDSTKSLRDLQIGKVEKAIGEIEGHRYDSEHSSDEMDICIENYKRLLEEKLPPLIENIRVLGRYIRETAPVYGFPGGFKEIHCKLYSRKSRKGPFSMWAERNLGTPFQVQFVFSNPDSLKEISMYTLSNKVWEWWCDIRWAGGGKYSPGEKRNHPALIMAGTADEFSNKYIKMVLNQLEKEGNSPFLDLPILLSEVPDAIVALCESRSKDIQRISGGIQARNEQLTNLNVSDFE